MTQASYRKPMIGERKESAPAAPTATMTEALNTPSTPKAEKARQEGTGYPKWLQSGAKDTATGYPMMSGTKHVSGCQGTYSSIM